MDKKPEGRFETSEKVPEFLHMTQFLFKERKTVRFSEHEKPPKWYNGC
jgi:hypothetical protein